MLNETGARRRRSNPAPAIRWWCALLACVVGAAATAAAAQAPEGTYRWHGELVALDEAAGTVTLTAPMAAPAGSEAIVGLEAGEPIVVTWSERRGRGRRDSGRAARRRWGSVGRHRPGSGRQPSAAGDLRRHGCGPRQPHVRGAAAGGEPGCGAGADARRAGRRVGEPGNRVGRGGARGRPPPAGRRGPRRSGEQPTAGGASWSPSTRRPVR